MKNTKSVIYYDVFIYFVIAIYSSTFMMEIIKSKRLEMLVNISLNFHLEIENTYFHFVSHRQSTLNIAFLC